MIYKWDVRNRDIHEEIFQKIIDLNPSSVNDCDYDADSASHAGSANKKKLVMWKAIWKKVEVAKGPFQSVIKILQNQSLKIIAI